MVPLLSIFAAVLLGLSWPAVVPSAPPPDLPGTVLGLVLAWLSGRLIAANAVRRVRATGEHPAAALLRAGAQGRIAIVLAYAFVVYGCHWPAVVSRLSLTGTVLLPELIALAPFFLMLGVSFLTWHAAESRLGLSGFSRRGYLLFQFRQVLLPLAPLLAFLLLGDLADLGSRSGLRLFAEATILHASHPFVQWLTLAFVLMLLYCALPFFLRFLWRAYPLPEGPLRRRLTEYSRRVGFRARDILVWPTEMNVMNAAVIGFAGPVRYVLLSDALIEALPEEEIEAVFAHEAGHAHHRHVPLFFLFTVGYTLLAFLAGSFAERRIPALFADPTFAYLAFALLTFLLWFGTLFGFLSRRFEQQADVFGAVTCGGEDVAPADHPFLRALEGLSRQMGDIREVKGWRHFSLADRISFLERYLTDPGTRSRYRHASAGLVAFFLLLLAALAGAAASTVPAQLREGRVTSALLRADWFSSRGDQSAAVAEGLRALDAAARNGTPLRSAALSGREEDDRERILRLLEWTTRIRLGEPRWSAVLHRAWLARLLLSQNEPRFSLAVSEEVLVLAGDHPAPLEDTGIALLLLGRPRGARLAFEDALARSGTDEVRQRRLPRYIEVAKAFEEAAAQGGGEARRRALDLAREAGLPLLEGPSGNR